MTTPTEHVNELKNLCEEIKQNNSFIENCFVDDWGAHSNFQIIVIPTEDTFNDNNKGLITRRINAIFDRNNTDFHRRQTISPVANRRFCSYSGKTETVGYNANYWMIDIDYHLYDPINNRFE